MNRLLGFSPAVAARFERDTGAARVAHLRRTILIGILFYNAYNLTSIILMPDILWFGVILRVMFVTPFSLGLAWVIGHVPAALREALVAAGMVNAILVPIALFWMSEHPLATYTFGELTLSLVFGTMMLVLRVPHAIAFVCLALLTSLVALATKTGLDGQLALAFALQAVTGSFFVLYGNYQIEAARRGTYLVSLRAIIRADGLETDRREFAALSTTDALTGLPNRRRLDEALAEWNAMPVAERAAIGVVMVDVDHFKAFNDAYGHPAGDACLRRVGEALAGEVRGAHDLAVRYGGEEFAVLLRHCGKTDLELMLARLRAAVEALAIPHHRNGEGAGLVTISLGGALAPVGFRGTPEALFSVADGALYEAKRTGRNRYVLGEPETNPAAHADSMSAAA